MTTLDKSFHLKHRKPVEFLGSPQKKLTCDSDSPYFHEEKKEIDFEAFDTLNTDKVLDNRSSPPPYPVLPIFRGRCFLSEGVFPSDHFSHHSVYRDTVRIMASLAILFIAPLLMWDGYPINWGVQAYFRHVEFVWSSLLHISTWPIAFVTLIFVLICPTRDICLLPQLFAKYLRPKPRYVSCFTSHSATGHWKISLVVSLLLTLCASSHLFLQMAFPSMLWNPFMWGWYRIYSPTDIENAIEGGCFSNFHVYDSSTPLCLNEHQWNELSSGTLSSLNSDDVESVIKGLDYVQNRSRGIIINILARNVADGIAAFRQNVEGLLPFLNGNVISVVIFENDSVDGTRDLIKQWEKEESSGEGRYKIDLISCGESNPDCLLNVMDRYENMPSFSNPKASGVGKLGDFRQIVMDHILNTPDYDEYSHMIVLDVDLGISISPLGLFHSLGLNDAELARKYVIASSSCQVWPGTFGTITPPYDLSAFRPIPTSRNERLRNMHKFWCELMPSGDRWRNMCEAASPMQLFLVRSNDDAILNNSGKPYVVGSAFNGLALYPLSLIRDKVKTARYDAGEDNQRCEHVGFNLSLQDYMYVNPKWKMHLKPSKPGGPSGFVVVKTILLTFFARIPVMTAVLFGTWIFFSVFVLSTWMIGIILRRALLNACPRFLDRT